MLDCAKILQYQNTGIAQIAMRGELCSAMKTLGGLDWRQVLKLSVFLLPLPESLSFHFLSTCFLPLIVERAGVQKLEVRRFCVARKDCD